jgi:hypothetical protein
VVIEQKQRVITDRLEVPVVGAAFLLAYTGLSLESMSSTVRSDRSNVSACPITSRFTAISPTRFSSRVSSSVLNQCNVDVSVFGDPMRRNVGSAETRAASLRSSYPAKRL